MDPSPILAALTEELRRVELAAYRAQPISAEDEAALIPLVDRVRTTLAELRTALEALEA